ncbi:MAG TPA: protein kinase [Polyangiales bacterium]|nr:protein kinase [Polyangiales bacterium]
MTELSPLPKTGDLIDGKYRVDHRIGSGAMSVVYQVTHRLTEKRFALKWLLPELAADADFAQRFLREAQVAGRFEHPNVVEVYDVGSSERGYYMVLELLIGESLHQRILRVDEIRWSDACRLLLPCLRAVAEAHDHGIVHRDLKPGNIFVCTATKNSAEHTKVLDFGLAKLARMPGEPTLIGTRSGVVMGTPSYMPLEQMRGEPIDHRVDIFALGVTLYQTLSGRLPFQAATLGDLVLVMANEPPAPLQRWARTMPEAVSAVLNRSLARDPEDRYPDMHAFLDALAPFVPPELSVEPRKSADKVAPVAASAAPDKKHTRVHASDAAPSRRRWLLPALLAIGLGLVASLGILHYGRQQSATREADHASAPEQTPPTPMPPPAEVGNQPPADQPTEVSPVAPEVAAPEPANAEPQPDPASSTAERPPEPAPAPAPTELEQVQPEDAQQRASRQWRQTHAFVSPPPTEPSVVQPPPPEVKPVPVQPMRPTRLRPMHQDEF